MNPGILNKRISIMKYKEVENEIGDIEQKLVEVKKMYASVRPVKGKEYIENKKIQHELLYKFIIRYTKVITQDMQIKYNNRIFNIQDIINPYENNKTLEIMAKEKIEREDEGELNEW